MDRTTDKPDGSQSLGDIVAELGTQAFSPDIEPSLARESLKYFDRFLKRTKTFPLIAALNKLILPGRVPSWLRTPLLDILTTLPMRPDGVRATVEFIFTVHPSSTVATNEAAVPQKRGANITQEALMLATKLLAAPPLSVTADAWFAALSPQLFALLDGRDGPELVKVASYVIGFGILGRRQFGAPGTPGWMRFADAMLRPIFPSLKPLEMKHFSTSGSQTDDIVEIGADKVLVSADNLALGIQRLLALLNSHPNPGLSRRLLSPVLLPLWALASWPDAGAHCEERYCAPARKLLGVYLKIAASPEKITILVQNVLYRGNLLQDDVRWMFKESNSGDLQIVQHDASRHDAMPSSDKLLFSWNNLDRKGDALLSLLNDTASDADISTVFLDIFSRWYASNDYRQATAIVTRLDEETGDPAVQLSEAKILQKMMEKFPEKLGAQSSHLLQLASQILNTARTSDGSDGENTGVAMSLLNLVVTSPGFRRASMDKTMLEMIETSLERIASEGSTNISATARNLLLLLKYRDELDEDDIQASGRTDRQIEDRKTYNLGMSYITQADSPPPVRSEGLNLIAGLVTANSSVLDIPAILVLLSTLLEENEDYINLRVIKVFTQLANKHPTTVTRELVERYVDANETASVDTRLRFGEALLQVIERLGATFVGDTAQHVGEALLSTAGRRGFRPKTKAKQAKDERLRKAKKREADDAWGGEVPDLQDEEETAEEKARNEILVQIVEGWESKRGSEDIRIRASALSIFGSGLGVNIGGIGSSLVSTAVDLSINILAMEVGPESAVLRRAAILVILDFVRALDKAKEEGRRLGFGLTENSQSDITRILEYISGTDNDGLVRQHARDVVESMENWKLGELAPQAKSTPALSGLAGLSINPDSSSQRPRIEEIE